MGLEPTDEVTIADLARARAHMGPLGQRKLDQALRDLFRAHEQHATCPDDERCRDRVADRSRVIRSLVDGVAEPLEQR